MALYYSLQEFMKCMGLGERVSWAAWLVKYLVIFFLLDIILVIIMSIPVNKIRILEYSDTSVMLALLILYTLTNIAFCFTLSTLFFKGKLRFFYLI